MAYNPTPYTSARAVTLRELRTYHEHEVSLECDNPADPDGDMIEHEFSLFFTIQPAEPDVGIMSEFLDDWFYAESDGSPVPEIVWQETDKIDARNDDRSPVSKAMNDWHERNLERALECLDDGGEW